MRPVPRGSEQFRTFSLRQLCMVLGSHEVFKPFARLEELVVAFLVERVVIILG
jgi:hypothetical protein